MNLNNRRNYYRILNVQPDASLDVIKTSYRAIMQKLKMHPDLGGDEWNASLINIAFNVLRNPEKRAEYDKKLLEQYCIKQLSKGHLHSSTKPSGNSNTQQRNDLNQRNYYRILHVQTDSPSAIILSSYETLYRKEQDRETKQLLKEAVKVLSNDQLKNTYDKLLVQHGHEQAIVLLSQKPKQQTQSQSDRPSNNTFLKAYQSTPQKIQATHIHRTHTTAGYQPLITQYCQFCKTPHNQSPSPVEAPLCIDCSSPLFPPSDDHLNQSRRGLGRQNTNNTIEIYLDWPGRPQRCVMLDISPTGIKIRSSLVLEQAQIIKIDANDYKAVGEVTYSQQQRDGIHSGIRFKTVMFDKQKGQFFSVKT